MIDVILRGGLSDDEHVMIPPKAQKPPLHKSGALAIETLPERGKERERRTEFHRSESRFDGTL